jgi:DNA-binding CsgD family transcriptional regulator
MGLSEKTVEYHWAEARKLFGLHTYVDACRFAIRNNLMTA